MPFGEGTVAQARRIVEAQLEPPAPPLVLGHSGGHEAARLYLDGDGRRVRRPEPRGRRRRTRAASLNETAHGLHHRQRRHREPAGHSVGADSRRRPARWTRWPATWTCDDRFPAGASWILEPPLREPARQDRERTRCLASTTVRPNQLRPTRLTPHYLKHAEGSVLIEVGDTRVICTASVEDRVPPFLRNTRQGLGDGRVRHAAARDHHAHAARGVGRQGRRPDAGDPAADRAFAARGHATSRSWASARSGSTATSSRRTAARAPASITGALRRARAGARQRMREQRPAARRFRSRDYVAATSVGIVDGEPLLDLAYEEDSRADVDMNIVKTGDGRFIEVQGTAEAAPFGRDALADAARPRRRGHPPAHRPAARDRGGCCEVLRVATDAGGAARRLLLATTNPGKLRGIRQSRRRGD